MDAEASDVAYLKPHHRLTGSFLAPIPHARELMRDPLDAKGCFMRWEAMPLPPHATPLLFDAMHALRMSMNGLAQELGSSRMTGQRWGSGRAHPSDAQIHTLARKVYPVDAALASKLAAAVGKTLPALGLVPAPAAPAVRDRDGLVTDAGQRGVGGAGR